MNSKTISSFFVALFAAVLVVPLLGASSLASAVTSAFQPGSVSHPGGDDGNLYADPETFVSGQTVKFTANFPNSAANKVVTLYKESGANTFVSTGKTDAANAKGNAYINYAVTGNQRVFAMTSDNQATEIKNLEPAAVGSCADTGNFYITPSTVAEGQTVKLTGNFPSSDANRTVTFLRKLGGGAFQSVGTDAANGSGNAYLNHEVADGPQTFYALITSTNNCTEQHSVTPVESNAELTDIKAANTVDARAYATFVPAQPGAKTELQAFHLGDKKWKTIETGTQDKNGNTVIYISDPLEVEHQYRVVSNGIATTNDYTYAAPLLDKANGVPTVHFNSNDGASVNTRSKYFKGEFSIKAGTTDQNKDNSFENCAGVAPFEAEMKGRGNYSWSFDKKGFNLKFPKIDSDKKYDLCGMGKSRKWALVANHYDRSLLRNSAAGYIGKQMGNLEFTPKDITVDLYVNGSYRGAYILIERVNFEGGRLDEDELKAEDTPDLCSGPDPSVDTNSIVNGSYLLEWDFRKGANFNFGANNHGWVGLKEPEDEDYCENMGAFINDYVDRADRDLYDGSADSTDWLSSIDLASAVDYYLAMEFLKPVDGQMWASVYMYKPRGEKLHMGPLWDFDLGLGSANRAGNVVSPNGWYLRNPINVSAKQTEVTWFNRMNQNPQFRAAVKARWNQVRNQLKGVSAYVRKQEGLIGKSASDNYAKWSHGSKISQYQVIKGSWGSDVDYLVKWLDDRWKYMDGQF